MNTNTRIKNLGETNKHKYTNFFICLFVTICKKIPSLIRQFVVIREQPGFGLLEVLISVGILALVTGGVVGLGNISVKNSVISADRTVAYNLAQEGKEALKQIRDTKWVDGLPNATNTWNEKFDHNGGTYYIGTDADGKFYLTNTDSSVGTKEINSTTYTRSVTFSAPDVDVNTNLSAQIPVIDNANNDWMIKAIVNVSWEEYGRPWSVVMPVYFTDWLPL